jgi:hypothetical protein
MTLDRVDMRSRRGNKRQSILRLLSGVNGFVRSYPHFDKLETIQARRVPLQSSEPIECLWQLRTDLEWESSETPLHLFSHFPLRALMNG